MRLSLNIIIFVFVYIVFCFGSSQHATGSKVTNFEPKLILDIQNFNAEYSFTNSDGIVILNDEVKKKRSHKRRRKVRPPRKGR
ncbi:MAG: hypothetical protein ISR90_01635 [Candidatus Marinimicrobia bacterium]|nr:hypothetical protein [Candidatus Neomarinimicrobiota bacterium]